MKDWIINFICNTMYFARSLSSFRKSCRFPYRNEELGSINILGTGPSLKAVIDTICKSDTQMINFALNDFGVSEFYCLIKPQYYVVVDPAYWMESMVITERDQELRSKLFESLNNQTNWPLILFVPWQAYQTGFFQCQLSNNNIKITPFNYTNFYPSYSSFYNKILSWNMGVVPVGNVLGCAIYLSINMGYKEVRIYGAEHSWTADLRVNEQNQVCTVRRHFFEEDEMLVPWLKSNKEVFKMAEILESLKNHFKGYEYLNWYANNKNCRIINCTKKSFIDAFARK